MPVTIPRIRLTATLRSSYDPHFKLRIKFLELPGVIAVVSMWFFSPTSYVKGN